MMINVNTNKNQWYNYLLFSEDYYIAFDEEKNADVFSAQTYEKMYTFTNTDGFDQAILIGTYFIYFK